jgi:FHA domain
MPTYRIGRRTDNDIIIDEPSISRRHAELFDVGDGTYRLRDLESRMGTLVRGPDGWNPIDLIEVDAKTPIRLGNYRTTVAELLVLQGRQPQPAGRSGGGYETAPHFRLRYIILGGLAVIVLGIAAVAVFWGDVPKQRFVEICVASGKVPSLCNCWADAFEPNLNREELLEVAEVIKRGAGSDQMNPALRTKYEGLVPFVKSRCPGTQ